MSNLDWVFSHTNLKIHKNTLNMHGYDMRPINSKLANITKILFYYEGKKCVFVRIFELKISLTYRENLARLHPCDIIMNKNISYLPPKSCNIHPSISFCQETNYYSQNIFFPEIFLLYPFQSSSTSNLELSNIYSPSCTKTLIKTN